MFESSAKLGVFSEIYKFGATEAMIAEKPEDKKDMPMPPGGDMGGMGGMGGMGF